MTRKPSLIQLTHTRNWVPKHESLDTARVVFNEYSRNWEIAEELAHLSATLRSDDPQKAANELLSRSMVERLVRRNYLSTRIAHLALSDSQFTLKSRVAMNFVLPFVAESGVSAELVEPFVGREIIPDLFKNLQHETTARRKEELHNAGLL